MSSFAILSKWVAEYLTELPPVDLLRSRLHLAIELAREQAARRIGDGE